MRQSAGRISVTTNTEAVEDHDVAPEDEAAAVEADATEAIDSAIRGGDAVRRLLRRAARANRAALDRLAR